MLETDLLNKISKIIPDTIKEFNDSKKNKWKEIRKKDRMKY